MQPILKIDLATGDTSEYIIPAEFTQLVGPLTAGLGTAIATGGTAPAER